MTTQLGKWIRVSRSNQCPICGKPDWCVIGTLYVNCMRVQSDKPCKDGGWLHPIDSKAARPTPRPKESEAPKINATAMMRDWRSKTEPEWIENFANVLGVSAESLSAIGTAWAADRKAWAFPMLDGYRNVIGVRLRSETGQKWAVTGSRAGIFMGDSASGTALICEGPTDTCAALTLGYNAIGRPSCLGSEDIILTALKDASRVLIVADNDSAGWNGAVKLQQKLKCISLCWAPPSKDLRSFIKAGGTRATLESITSNFVWTNPVIT